MSHQNNAKEIYEGYLTPILNMVIPEDWTHKSMQVGKTYAIIMKNMHGEIMKIIDITDCYPHLHHDDTITRYFKTIIQDLLDLKTGEYRALIATRTYKGLR